VSSQRSHKRKDDKIEGSKNQGVAGTPNPGNRKNLGPSEPFGKQL